MNVGKFQLEWQYRPVSSAVYHTASSLTGWLHRLSDYVHSSHINSPSTDLEPDLEPDESPYLQSERHALACFCVSSAALVNLFAALAPPTLYPSLCVCARARACVRACVRACAVRCGCQFSECFPPFANLCVSLHTCIPGCVRAQWE